MADFIDDGIMADYLAESRDIIAQVETALISLEKKPQDADLLNQIFRGFHTIKGGAGFIQADGLVNICHVTEFLFDQLRAGHIRLNPQMMDSILAVTARITVMLDELSRHGSAAASPAELISVIESWTRGEPTVLPRAVATPVTESAVVAKPTQAASRERSFAVHQTGGEAASVVLDWPALYEAALGQTASRAASPVMTSMPLSSDPVSAGPAASEPVKKTRNIQVGTEESDEGAASHHRRMRPTLQSLSSTEEKTVRVDTRRLDKVLNLSGEIGLVRNALRNICSGLLGGGAHDHAISRLDAEVNRLNALVNRLHESAMRIRMQPIGRLFQKYQRTIRDMARSLDKSVELIVSGEETELDKTMVDELSDPLVHMLRNAIDHGIECKEERELIKKPPIGKIMLSAAQEGDHIVIRLSDDGRGMDPEKLRRIAMKKGLISEDDALKLNDAQSLQLIFMPGFSSAESVTNLSGRGVGMDVVMTNLKNMNGDVEIHSVVGSGTTFELRVPLTLMMMPIVVIGINEQPFAIPLSLVREVIPIRSDEIYEMDGYAACQVRQEILPIINLAACLSLSTFYPPNFGVVICYGDICVVLGVDRFYRRDEAVVRSLNGFKPRGITGMTTSSEGESILILDIKDLSSIFYDHKIPRHQWTRLFVDANQPS